MKTMNNDNVYSPDRFPDRIPLIIDTDAANEIDDLYAIALALVAQERFLIHGFVATHFAAAGGRESTQKSYDVLMELLKVASVRLPVEKGGDPFIYPGEPSPSLGSDFIIETALQADPENPLFILGIGAASNIVSAILREPRIKDRIVVMFHGRSEDTWPHSTRQYNIIGDVIAAQHLLDSGVSLIWFNTGTSLCASMKETENRLLPLGEIGRFLHEYRFRDPIFQSGDKGFFDLGDIAWLLEPDLCTFRSHDVPRLTRWLGFEYEKSNRQMLLVESIQPEATWDLFFRRLGGAM